MLALNASGLDLLSTDMDDLIDQTRNNNLRLTLAHDRDGGCPICDAERTDVNRVRVRLLPNWPNWPGRNHAARGAA